MKKKISDSRDFKCFPGDVPNATNKILESNENRKKKLFSVDILKFVALGKKEGMCKTCGKGRNGR